MNGTFKRKMKIWARNREDPNRNGNFSPYREFMGFGSWVHIYNNNHGMDNVHYSTLHEIGHAAHWGMGKKDYKKSNKIVKESWAVGIASWLVRDYYPNFTPRNISRRRHTNIMIDMNDGSTRVKTTTHYWDGDAGEAVYLPKSYTESVSGYVMHEMSDALKGARTWDAWKNNLKKQNNATKIHLDDLFDYWESI